MQKKLFIDYVKCAEKHFKNMGIHTKKHDLNPNILDIMEQLRDVSNPKYKDIIQNIKQKIKSNNVAITEATDFESFQICD